MGWDLILRAAWAFRFPIVCGLLLLSLGAGWKVYTWQHGKAVEAEQIAKTAIEEHDAAMAQLKELQLALAEREKIRIRREEENAKLWSRLDRVLQSVREWASAPLPDAIRRLPMDLQAGVPDVPRHGAAGTAAGPANPTR